MKDPCHRLKKGILKILGLNYTIQYMKLKENGIAFIIRKGARQGELVGIMASVVPLRMEYAQQSYRGMMRLVNLSSNYRPGPLVKTTKVC